MAVTARIDEMAAARKRNRARVDFRPKPEQKELFEQAAALEGQSLSEFLVRSAEERARRILQEHELLELRGAASARFVQLLSNPPKPTEKLRAAFEKHDREVESR